MSLALIQGYSSAEEEDNQQHPHNDDLRSSDSSDYDDGGDGDVASAAVNRSIADRSLFDRPHPNAAGLPSAFDAFSEVSAPPDFLNNAVTDFGTFKKEVDLRLQSTVRHGKRRNHRDKRDMPAGAVMESKPQLVGIHERVRSDMEGSQPTKATDSTAAPGGKRVATAANPNAEDAADLLRMCLPCGIPKTFSNPRGMVCPVCGDRPATEPAGDAKKKGSGIKDKEKNKRMKGQSSHATWKSETEMQLRQQFD